MSASSAFFCKRSPRTGSYVLDKAKLAAVVKVEGLSFVDATANLDSISEYDWHKPAVILLNGSQVVKPHSCPDIVGYLVRAEDADGRRCKHTVIEVDSSQLQISKWIRESDDRECIVCYEPTGNQNLEEAGIGCKCGTVVCFGCSIDLLLIAPKEMTTECPNCRCQMDAHMNLRLLINVMYDTVPGVAQIGGISAEHMDFIEKMTGVDLRLSRERATAQVKRLYFAYDEIMGKVLKFKKGKHFWTPKSSARMYAAVREFIERKRKKKVVSASADDSRNSALVARRGCANCGKQFWDKSEWKRALKCDKCQRTAYCSAKCRKKHVKAHTAQCSAKGAKQKRRPTKKKHKEKERRLCPVLTEATDCCERSNNII